MPEPVLGAGARARIAGRVTALLGAGAAGPLVESLEARLAGLIEAHGAPAPRPALDARDAVLITYADQVRRDGEPPLATLGAFLREAGVEDLLPVVHLLPFFPSTSDDGFAVADYEAVDPRAGTWSDVAALGTRRGLVLDLVLNHCSASHPWFDAWRRRDPRFARWFVEGDPEADHSAVVRPRALPLLTRFDTADGPRHVWTTFSEDQVDLDYSEPAVLLEMLCVLAGYVLRGARIVRLDAVAYLWKSPGTPCIHLPQTHEVVKLMRDLVDALAPGTIILTETNVPHAENVSYFGDGDEAGMVYQFPLPPLLLDAVTFADPAPLRAWLRALEPAPPGCAYFNFTASHDGVGLRPLEGLVPAQRLARLTEAVRARGALVSARAGPDGTTTPYELNVAYVDAVAGDDPDPAAQAGRFLATQAFMLALRGVPGVYFHSLVGSPNDLEGVRASGQARRINRHRYTLDALRARLSGGRQRLVLDGYRRMLRLRAARRAFHPQSAQTCVDAGEPGLVVLVREGEGDAVLVVANLGRHPVAVDCGALAGGGWRRDLLSGAAVAQDGTFTLGAPRVAWLVREPAG